MCHRSVLDFFGAELSIGDVESRRILEVGSMDVNGTVRPFFMSLGARDYLGVDMAAGPGVDRVCDVASLPSALGGESFDVVVTTEMLEHVRDWRTAVGSLKTMVAPGGLLVITTRSFGYPYHAYPGDYWRYELSDMQTLFADFQILKLLPDPEGPGVFLKCRKPVDFHEIDVSRWKLFSVVKGERSEPDAVADEEIQAYAQRMGPIMENVLEVARLLRGIDLADVGQRDFRNLWQSVEHLSNQIERLRRQAPSPWSKGITRGWRRLLEMLTAARLARGGSFGWARQALLESAAGTSATDVPRIPWAAVDEEPFREILRTLESIRAPCVKIHSYARPLIQPTGPLASRGAPH